MNKYVLSMGTIRILFALFSGTIAIIMLVKNDPRIALRLNAVIGLVGPLVLMVTSALGIAGSLRSLNFWKTLLVLTGTALIFIGTR